MNQLVIAILATIAGVAMLRAITSKDVGVHAGGLLLMLLVALASVFLLIVIVSFNLIH
ncbi:MAG: hypothetical protein ACXWLO_04560 [Rhizomicrobium sp.]